MTTPAHPTSAALALSLHCSPQAEQKDSAFPTPVTQAAQSLPKAQLHPGTMVPPPRHFSRLPAAWGFTAGLVTSSQGPPQRANPSRQPDPHPLPWLHLPLKLSGEALQCQPPGCPVLPMDWGAPTSTRGLCWFPPPSEGSSPSLKPRPLCSAVGFPSPLACNFVGGLCHFPTSRFEGHRLSGCSSHFLRKQAGDGAGIHSGLVGTSIPPQRASRGLWVLPMGSSSSHSRLVTLVLSSPSY